MSTHELDDPRARELTRLAHQGMQAALVVRRKPIKVSADFEGWFKPEREFNSLLDAYQELRAELGKHEQVVYCAEPPGEEKAGPPWRNDGE